MALIKKTEKSSEKPGYVRDYMKPRRSRKRRRMADTEAGSMDDDARKRMEKRRKMLEGMG